MANLWIKDQDGNPSVIVSLVLVSFIATTAAFVLSIVEKVGTVAIRPFDATAAGAYFGAVLAAYVSHKWVSSKYDTTSTLQVQPPQVPSPQPPANITTG